MFASEKPHYSKVEIILELISISALLTFLIFTFYIWPTVPERIPTHYGWSGLPDSWGSKGTFPTMIYVTLFIYILFSILSRFPRAINSPISFKDDKSKLQIINIGTIKIGGNGTTQKFEGLIPLLESLPEPRLETG